MAAGEVVGNTLTLLVRNLHLVIVIALPFLLAGILISVILGFTAARLMNSGAAWALSGVLSWTLLAAQRIALVSLCGDLVEARPASVRRALSTISPNIGTVLLADLIVLPMAIILMLLVVGIPIAVYIVVRWLFYPQIIVLEHESSPIFALGRSAALVAGQWQRVFGIMLLWIPILFLFLFILIPISVVLGALSGGVFALLVPPFIAALFVFGQTILYFVVRAQHDDMLAIPPPPDL